MTQVIEKDKCCGCAACFTSCAHKAISMQLDMEGFEYPEINQEACTDCGLCQATCPVVQYEKRQDLRKTNYNTQVGFAARNKNYDQRLISSSGSIFPPIAEWVLDQGGMVVGVSFDKDFNAVHKIIDKKEDLVELQGSKYLQCKADNETFKIIRKEIQTGRKVLYSGMACQVEGLKSFLRKDYENLYTIDLICMGIPSYIVWQKYLKAFFPNEKIRYVNFKEKSVGWDSFCFRIETDKQTFKERGMQNLYLRSMFLTWNMRPSCFQCPFKNTERISDFTLADAWGVSKQTPQINDNKGLSSVVVHSKKGLELWNTISDRFDSIKVSLDEIAKNNSNLISNKPQSGNRKLFYRMFAQNPEEAFVKLCTEYEPSRIECMIINIKNKVKTLLSLKFWTIDKKKFNELYDYDMKFNASFRGKKTFSKEELSMLQIKYLWYYRKTQAAKDSIWQNYYRNKLIKFSNYTSIQLYENMNIPKGLIIGHPGTIIINENATFDGNIMMTHGVTIGRDVREKRAGSPHFGKNVCIRCNSTVVGGITIGDDVLIAPNTFVNFDVPSHSIIIGNPATIHHRDNATEGHIGKVE